MPPYLRFQALAIDIFHDDVVMPRCFSTIEHAHNGRMVQSGGYARLAKKSLSNRSALNQMRVQELDRHVEIEILMVPAIHDAHTAFAQTRQDPAVTDTRELHVGIVGHSLQSNAAPGAHPGCQWRTGLHPGSAGSTCGAVDQSTAYKAQP